MADITRKDWVAKTGEEQVAIADAIFAKLNKASKYAYQQGYTNSFIGVRSGAKPCNFFTVIPQKKATLLSIRVQQSAENDKLVEQVSKSGVKYTNGWYAISFASAEGLDGVIPILLQAEAEFKKEKGENALTLHEDVVEETNSTAQAETELARQKAEAEAAQKELERIKAETAKAQAEAAAAKAAAEKAAAEAAKAKEEAAKAAAEQAKAEKTAATTANQGVLSGLFSVAENKKVRFSMGNLQFNPKKYEFRFALHQYDVIGNDNSKIAPNYDCWIDLFGYGTSGYMGCEPTESSTTTDQYPKQIIAGTNYDWGVYNPISNGGNKEGLWRTLTNKEWEFLFNGRANAAKLRAKACVNGINGAIILPDDFYEHRVRVLFDSTPDDFAGNTYDLSQWATLEAAGAIFLPCCGIRRGATICDASEKKWSYWTSSVCTTNYYYAYRVQLFNNVDTNNKDYGRAVRLVQDVK